MRRTRGLECCAPRRPWGRGPRAGATHCDYKWSLLSFDPRALESLGIILSSNVRIFGPSSSFLTILFGNWRKYAHSDQPENEKLRESEKV